MRVLIGCEESQAVCKAFRERGHEAYSCDLIECSGGHPEWHLQMDVIEAIEDYGPWDFIGLHLPCTCVAVSGNSTYGKEMPKYQKRVEAVRWMERVWNIANQHAKHVYLENPVGVLNSMGSTFPGPQYIQPYMFGHMEQKKTGLWLSDLWLLKETDNVYDEMMKLPKNERERIHYLPPSEDRAKLRSKTYTGIAKAMAEQWG